MAGINKHSKYFRGCRSSCKSIKIIKATELSSNSRGDYDSVVCYAYNKFFILILKLYQTILSPILHTISLSTVGGGCRFYPSCSEYCKQAINLYGFNAKSIKLSLFRILRCQPFVSCFLFKNIKFKTSGYDPLEN